MYTFGPVPSRRLGRSLGINNIPPKICTYACIYCQLGNSIGMQIDRTEFYKPEMILKDVKNKIKKAEKLGEEIDYLTFVPDGEPTLDINLGREIDLLKPLGINIAVITNSSLIWQEDIRNDLRKADWISLKVDTINEYEWHKINRPHGKLRLEKILAGCKEFAIKYNGNLVTETMLILGINDSDESLKSTAEFISALKPTTSYISIPTRPPAVDWVTAPDTKIINRAYQIFESSEINVELITGYEGNEFAFSGDVENDLLSITSVHPMRKDAVVQFIAKANSDWTIIQRLIDEKKIVELEYEGEKFYLRNLKKIIKPTEN